MLFLRYIRDILAVAERDIRDRFAPVCVQFDRVTIPFILAAELIQHGAFHTAKPRSDRCGNGLIVRRHRGDIRPERERTRFCGIDKEILQDRVARRPACHNSKRHDGNV